jgi:REP element-mobilizing transposase RayT
MARLARVVIPEIPHHVTQRGVRRQQTLFSDADYLAYLHLAAEAFHEVGVQVWAYCLTPNHVHLIATPPRASALAAAVGATHQRYTRQINQRQHALCGPQSGAGGADRAGDRLAVVQRARPRRGRPRSAADGRAAGGAAGRGAGRLLRRRRPGGRPPGVAPGRQHRPAAGRGGVGQGVGGGHGTRAFAAAPGPSAGGGARGGGLGVSSQESGLQARNAGAP